MLAMMGVFDFVGTIGSGWLSDRYDNRKLLFWYYGLRGLSLLFLPMSEFSFYGLSLFAVFYGLDWIATVPPTVKLPAMRSGGTRRSVFGWVFTAHQLGGAAAALSAGLSRTALDACSSSLLRRRRPVPRRSLAGSDIDGGEGEAGHCLSSACKSVSSCRNAGQATDRDLPTSFWSERRL